MNSRWNENLIIFTMALVSTRSIAELKLRFLGPLEVNFTLNLVKLAKNIREAWVWCKTLKSDIFRGF